MHPLIQLKKTTPLFIIALALVCFAISPMARAVVPPPDGGYANFNTAEGQNALFSLTTGAANTAIGWRSLFLNSTGSFNTGVGAGALVLNTGDSNTATGAVALLSNTIGIRNTANGASALFTNATGIENMANGFQALYNNTSGSENTANGAFALFHNTIGHDNTANGQAALVSNTTGNDNTAVGVTSLDSNTTGNNNIAVGSTAGFNLTVGDFNIDIGNAGVADEANTIRIGDESVQGATFIAGISGQNATGGDAVFVTSTGKLGTVNVPSAARFKDDIKPMDKASEVILTLKPVTFHYKKEVDSNGVRQFGLVAEEVEKIAPDLVKRDREGKLQTVRYDAVNAMLLNEFLKEHRKVEQMQKQIETLTAGLQKVSAQLATASPSRGGLEMNKPAPQTAANNQ